ncbi:MAG: leucine-rich repeat protein [Actinomycetes bacterium]|jgi:hypothetical protein|nr:leucine-rich repeat protein [Actinomycetes bacterium]
MNTLQGWFHRTFTARIRALRHALIKARGGGRRLISFILACSMLWSMMPQLSYAATWTGSDFTRSGATITGLSTAGKTKLNSDHAPTIPNTISGTTITGIGANAFANDALTGITVPANLTTIAAKAFANNALTTVNLPNSVTSIAADAFDGNGSVVRVIIATPNPALTSNVKAGDGYAINPVTITVHCVDNKVAPDGPNPIYSDQVLGADYTTDQVFPAGDTVSITAPTVAGYSPVADTKTVTAATGAEVTFEYKPAVAAPVITATNRIVELNTTIDETVLRSWVSAVSGVDGQAIPDANITVTPTTIDSSYPSDTSVSYSVVDQYGNVGSKNIKVSVVAGVMAQYIPDKTGTLSVWQYQDFSYDNNKLTGFSTLGAAKFATYKNLVLPGVRPDTNQPLVEVNSDAGAGLAFNNFKFTSIDFSQMTSLKTIADGSGDAAINTATAPPATAKGVFTNQTLLTTIDLSPLESLEYIGVNAFLGATSVQSINFSGLDNLKTIGVSAFQWIYLSTSSTLNLNGLKRLETIGNQAFAHIKVTSLTLNDLPKLKTIGMSSFYRTTELKTLVIEGLPELEIINNSAFECYTKSGTYPGSKLESLTIKDCPKLETIAQQAFQTAPLTTLSLENLPGLKVIGLNCFAGERERGASGTTPLGCELTTLDLSGAPNLEVIGIAAFRNLQITTLDLSANKHLKLIRRDAFKQVPLTSISFDGLTELTTIGAYAFYKATLTKLDLTDCASLEYISYDPTDEVAKETAPTGGAVNENAATGWGAGAATETLNMPSSNIYSQAALFGEVEDGYPTDPAPTTGFYGRAAFGYAQLSTLDLSGNPHLKFLGGFEKAQLTKLDLSTCPELQAIGPFAFRDSPMFALGIAGLSNLKAIGRAAFAQSKMTDLDLSGDRNLLTIWDDAFVRAPLTHLDVTGLAKLKRIGPRAFKGAILTELDLTEMPNLTWLDDLCQNEGRIDTRLVGVAGEPANGATPAGQARTNWTIAQTFLASPITYLDFSKSSKLKILGGSAFQMYAGTTIDFSGCTSLELIGAGLFDQSWGGYLVTPTNPTAGEVNTKLTSISFKGCTNLKRIEFASFWGKTAVTSIDFTGCENLEVIEHGSFQGPKIDVLDLSDATHFKAITAASELADGRYYWSSWRANHAFDSSTLRYVIIGGISPENTSGNIYNQTLSATDAGTPTSTGVGPSDQWFNLNKSVPIYVLDKTKLGGSSTSTADDVVTHNGYVMNPVNIKIRMVEAGNTSHILMPDRQVSMTLPANGNVTLSAPNVFGYTATASSKTQHFELPEHPSPTAIAGTMVFEYNTAPTSGYAAYHVVEIPGTVDAPIGELLTVDIGAMMSGITGKIDAGSKIEVLYDPAYVSFQGAASSSYYSFANDASQGILTITLLSDIAAGVRQASTTTWRLAQGPTQQNASFPLYATLINTSGVPIAVADPYVYLSGYYDAPTIQKIANDGHGDEWRDDVGINLGAIHQPRDDDNNLVAGVNTPWSYGDVKYDAPGKTAVLTYKFKVTNVRRNIDTFTYIDTIPTYIKVDQTDGSLETVPAEFVPARNPGWVVTRTDMQGRALEVQRTYTNVKMNVPTPELVLGFPFALDVQEWENEISFHMTIDDPGGSEFYTLAADPTLPLGRSETLDPALVGQPVSFEASDTINTPTAPTYPGNFSKWAIAPHFTGDKTFDGQIIPITQGWFWDTNAEKTGEFLWEIGIRAAWGQGEVDEFGGYYNGQKIYAGDPWPTGWLSKNISYEDVIDGVYADASQPDGKRRGMDTRMYFSGVDPTGTNGTANNISAKRGNTNGYAPARVTAYHWDGTKDVVVLDRQNVVGKLDFTAAGLTVAQQQSITRITVTESIKVIKPGDTSEEVYFYTKLKNPAGAENNFKQIAVTYYQTNGEPLAAWPLTSHRQTDNPLTGVDESYYFDADFPLGYYHNYGTVTRTNVRTLLDGTVTQRTYSAVDEHSFRIHPVNAGIGLSKDRNGGSETVYATQSDGTPSQMSYRLMIDVYDGVDEVMPDGFDTVLNNVTIIDVLPDNFNYDTFTPSNEFKLAATGLTVTYVDKDTAAASATYNHINAPLLVIKANTLTLAKLVKSGSKALSDAGIVGVLSGKVAKTAPSGVALVNNAYMTYANDPSAVHQGVGDSSNWETTDTNNPFGATGVLKASARVNVIGISSLLAEKTIRAMQADGSYGPWSATGIQTSGVVGNTNNFEYRLTVSNAWPSPYDGVQVLDVLPYADDKAIVPNMSWYRGPRYSEFQDANTDVIAGPPATAVTVTGTLNGGTPMTASDYVVEYLMSNNPIPDSFGNGVTADVWYATPPAGYTWRNQAQVAALGTWSDIWARQVRAVRVREVNPTAEMIKPDTLEVRIKMKAPTLSTAAATIAQPGMRAYNTFAYGADNSPLLETLSVYNELKDNPATIIMKKTAGTTANELTGAGLNGATFGLYDTTTGDLLMTATSGTLDNNHAQLDAAWFTSATNKTGWVVFPSDTSSPNWTSTNGSTLDTAKLWRGDYIVKEISPPAGYLPSDLIRTVNANSFVLTAPGTTTSPVAKLAYYSNTAEPVYGNLNITKTGGAGTAAAGVPFLITQVSSPYQTYSVVTDSAGKISLEHIPVGNYTIKEMSAPGILTPTGEFTVAVAASTVTIATAPAAPYASGTYAPTVSGNTVTIRNAYVNVTLLKLAALTESARAMAETDMTPSSGKALSGVQFRLYQGVPNTGTLVGTYATDATGKITFTNLVANTWYYVSEVAPPTDYVAIITPIRFQVNNAGQIVNASSVAYRSDMLIVKNLLNIQPAEITITKTKYTPSANGQLASNGTLGTIDPATGFAGVQFLIDKYDDTTGTYVNVPSLTGTTDSTGKVVITIPVPALGNYRIRESVPAGYLSQSTADYMYFSVASSTQIQKFTFSYTNTPIQPVIVKGDIARVYNPSIADERTNLAADAATLTSMGLTPHQMVRSDGMIQLIAGLGGATYEVAEYTGSVYLGTPDATYTVTTAADGSFTIPFGLVFAEGHTYTFREITAPYGYMLSETLTIYQPSYEAVSMKANGGKWITLEDKVPSHRIVLTKYKADNENELAGAQFLLYYADGTSVTTTLTTDAQGTLIVNNLNPGIYYLQEVASPPQYSVRPGYGKVTITGITDRIFPQIPVHADTIGATTPVLWADVTSSDTTVDAFVKVSDPRKYEITGSLWLDRDIDGVREANEPAIDGITVSLYQADGTTPAVDVWGNPVTATVTGNTWVFSDQETPTATPWLDGHNYAFDNLPAGNYVVVFTDGTGADLGRYSLSPKDAGGDDAVDSDANSTYTHTNPDTTTTDYQGSTVGTYSPDELTAATIPGVSIVNNPADEVWQSKHHDVGLWLPRTVSGLVWEDRNRNGVQDAGEDLISGVTVTLVNASTGVTVTADRDGNPITPQVTDATNGYVFTNLPDGEYYLVFTSTAGPGGANLGDYETTLRLTGTANEDKDSDVDGRYTNLHDLVDMSTQANHVISVDGTASASEHNDAGLFKPYVLAGLVWDDRDLDGIQDPDEPAIDGVKVSLEVWDASANGGSGGWVAARDDQGNLVPSQVTESSTATQTGFNYCFTALPAGQYRVTFESDTQWLGACDLTASDVGADDTVDSDATAHTTDGTGKLVTVSIDDAATLLSLTNTDSVSNDIGLRRTYEVSGLVWEDRDNDGLQDPGEPALAGVVATLFVQNPSSGAWTQVTTDAHGGTITPQTTTTAILNGHNYLFEDLPYGTYKVVFTDNVSGALLGEFGVSATNVGSDDTIDNDGVGGHDANGTLTSATIDGITLPADSLVDGWSSRNNDLGLTRSFEINGLVWEDTDNDGLVDSSEAPIPGTTVTLEVWDATANGGSGGWVPAHDVTGAVVPSQLTTDNAGAPSATYNYRFDDIPEGTYRVTFSDPSGNTLGDMSVTKRDVGSNELIDSDATQHGSGEGTKTATVSGIDTGPGIGTNGVVSGVNCGLVPNAEISGLVWDDADNDGIRDTGEVLLADGCLVVVYESDGTTRAHHIDGTLVATETVTVADYGLSGHTYEFTELPPGSYVVTLYDPSGTVLGVYGVTRAKVGNDPTVNNDAVGVYTGGVTDRAQAAVGGTDYDGNGHAYNIDFGLVKTYDISGLVWEDTDNDGVRDPGEPAIGDLTVNLLVRDPITGEYVPATDSQGTTYTAVVTTDTATGNTNWKFENLPEGDYKVVVTDGSGTTLADYEVAKKDVGTDDRLDSDAVAAKNDNSDLTTATVDVGYVTRDIDTVGIGLVPSYEIRGTVWNDTDNDGIRDSGETPLPGSSVQLNVWDPSANGGSGDWVPAVHVDGTPVLPQTVTTDTASAGYGYRFDELPAGTYQVIFSDPTGATLGDYSATKINQGTDDLRDSDATQTVLPNGSKTATISNIVLDPSVTGNISTGNDLGLSASYDINGYVWDDQDNDGIKDTGEPLLPGTTVDLEVWDPTANGGNGDWVPAHHTGGDIVLSIVTTDTDNGYNYLFEDLPQGEYRVVFTDPSEATLGDMSVTRANQGTDELLDSDATQTALPGTGKQGNIGGIIVGPSTVATGGASTGNNMGLTKNYEMSGLVWEDSDNNGIRDIGESLIGTGCVVVIYQADGTTRARHIDGSVVATESINNAGYVANDYTWHFEELPDGEYVIILYDPTGTVFGTYGVTQRRVGTNTVVDNDAVGIYTDNVTERADAAVGAADYDANGSARHIDFGLVQAYDLNGLVWNDADNDGVRDPGEDLMPGSTVTLYVWDADANGGAGGYVPATDISGAQVPPQVVTTDTASAGYTYHFVNLPEGTYQVVFTDPAGGAEGGWSVTRADQGGDDRLDSDATQTVVNGAKQAVISGIVLDPSTTTTDNVSGGNDVGLTPCYDLGGIVWDDEDNDGIRDLTEPLLPGTTVDLEVWDPTANGGGGGWVPATHTGGDPVLSVVTTDVDLGGGNYVFTDLPEGQYRVVFTDPSGDTLGDMSVTQTGQGADPLLDSDATQTATPGGGKQGNIGGIIVGPSTVTSDGVSVGNNMGLTKNYEISGLVWDDRNNNGVRDGSEVLIGDGLQVVVYLPDGTRARHIDGSVVATCIVDNSLYATDGYTYYFEELPPGSYTVTLLDAAGNVLSDYSVTRHQVGGNTTIDNDARGTYSGGGTDRADAVVGNANYDSDGSARHTDFGLVKTYTIDGLVWQDTDNDGVRDAGEPPIAGVNVNLYVKDPTTGQYVPARDSEGNLYPPYVTTTQVTADGNYHFVNVPQGDYRLVFTDGSGTKLADYEVAKKDVGDDRYDSDGTGTRNARGDLTQAAAAAGVITTDTAHIDIGLVPSYDVGGLVFDDKNGNGKQDPGEGPKAGIIVTITDPNGNPVYDLDGKLVGPVTTTGSVDSDGNNYRFDHLPAGDYTVTLRDADGNVVGSYTIHNPRIGSATAAKPPVYAYKKPAVAKPAPAPTPVRPGSTGEVAWSWIVVMVLLAAAVASFALHRRTRKEA